MRTFREFLLEDTLETQTVHLPAGTEVVSVSKTDKGIMLLAITTPKGYETELPEIRTFKICLTDENFVNHTVKYIGSFMSNIGPKHVIEIRKGF